MRGDSSSRKDASQHSGLNYERTSFERYREIRRAERIHIQLKIKAAVSKLTNEILTIEAEGSYEKSEALLDKYALIGPAMQNALDRLGDMPVDIQPNFVRSRTIADSVP
jgi:hypothetical protein